MKISYKILWIDDDPNSTQQDREDVTEFLEEYGIRADISLIEAPDDGSVRDRIQHDLKDPELDILMVDYHMDGMSGDELVRLIRETDHVYLPVIFYSSSDVDEILDAARQAKLDGVYITNRNFTLSKFQDVAKSLLNKEQTTKRTRGLLMEGVSEIDARFKEIYDAAWAILETPNREKLRTYLLKLVGKRAATSKKAQDEFPSDLDSFATHMAEKFITPSYDTHTRWRILMKMLNYLQHDETAQNLLKKFADKADGEGEPLNSIRNVYAHTTRAQLDEHHSVEKCVGIRRELREQQANVDAIVAGIS